MKKLIFSLILLFVSAGTLIAQSNDMIFSSLSLKQGLSENTITCIFQDREGFMWFGTRDGLNKYNGYTFTVFYHEPSDSFSLSSTKITYLAEGREGIFWVGTENGLNKYDPLTRRFYRFFHVDGAANSLADNKINTLFIDRTGMFWVGTNKGLCLFDRDSSKFLNFHHSESNPKSISSDRITTVFEDKFGTIWIGTENGLNMFDRTDNSFRQFFIDANTPAVNHVTAVQGDTTGTIWIGTDNAGLWKFDRKKKRFIYSFSQHSIAAGQLLKKISSLIFDETGTLWIGTNGGGLIRFEPKGNQYNVYRNSDFQPRSISSNYIASLFIDRSGIIWIGTYGKGINKLDRRLSGISIYCLNSGGFGSSHDNSIWSIFKDSKGIFWIGTREGLRIFDRMNNLYSHSNSGSKASNPSVPENVYVIDEDNEQNLWFGTDNGLRKYERKTRKITTYKNDPANIHSLSGDVVISLCVDSRGNVWAGTRSRGLNRLIKNSGKFRRYSPDNRNPDSLPDSRINQIYEDSKENLWICTNGGLCRYNGEAEGFITFTENPAAEMHLNYNMVSSIYEDSDGIYWIGTKGGGLNKFDFNANKCTCYTVSNGLPNNHVYGILEDNNGNLWLSTNRGLSRFNKETEEFTNFDENDGLQGNEFNAGAYYKNDNGELFFGGANGLNTFFPERITNNQNVPPVVITDIQINNQSIYLGNCDVFSEGLTRIKEITLLPKHKVLTFEFAALDYSAPENNQYAYMLEGLDNGWNYIGTRRYISFTGLPSGTYTFKVKGSNNDGVWNKQPTSVKIFIKPPFWNTTLFKAFSFLSVLLMAFLIYEWRVSNIEKQRLQLKSEVEIRTRELREARDELEKRVQERTRELSASNIKLVQEMRERKRNESERTKLEKQLYQAQKMESIGRLAGGIAHDFNNILAGIQGYAELLHMKFQDSESTEAKAAEVILNNSERASVLTKQLLGFARKGELKPKPVNLNKLINETLKVSEKIFEKKIEVITDLADIPNITADKNQIDQILTNLFVNAKDAMPDGGILSIKTSFDFLDEDGVKLFPNLQPGVFVKLIIADSGIGMSSEIKNKIFEPFFTTKEEGKGTGLGLATAYGIIRKHSGYIHVYSEPGKGTAFTVYLPATDSESTETGKHEKLIDGTGSILIVDDEQSVRGSIEHQLKTLGYTVFVAKNGKEALDIYMKNSIDLVMIDMIMPKMDGKETYLALRGIDPGVNAIIMSGFSQNEGVSDIIDLGAKSFIQKPFTLMDLSRVVSAEMNNTEES